MLPYSHEELLDRSLLHISAGQPDLALPFLNAVLAKDPACPPALDLLGEAHFDLGNLEEAMRCFRRSAEVAPEEAGTKWMFLGQMSHGEESLSYYSKGIALFEREASQDPLRRSQLASAHVSVAELFMSDLCMREDAEQRCEHACAEAQRIDPDSLEALQVTASMRLSQSRVEEATSLLGRVFAKLEASGHEAAYDFRVATARLLIEVEDNASALSVLERLVQEDDELAEVWMLLGVVHQLSDGNVARECYERALEILEGMAEHDADFAAMAFRVHELMDALEPQPETNGAVSSAEVQGGAKKKKKKR